MNKNNLNLYIKIIKSVPYCSNEESTEISKILDKLSEDDLKVVEEYEL